MPYEICLKIYYEWLLDKALNEEYWSGATHDPSVNIAVGQPKQALERLNPQPIQDPSAIPLPQVQNMQAKAKEKDQKKAKK